MRAREVFQMKYLALWRSPDREGAADAA